MTDQLVWIDCEMTGLDLARDALIEIACIVTDGQLVAADGGVDLVIKPPPEALDTMPEVVRDMHTASGLLSELASGITLAEAQEQVLAYVQRHVQEPRQAPLCGNSIATDRMFIARDMRELDAYLHYRMVDVSSVKELARRWYRRAYFASPEKHGGHRALADIRESIRELQYYREAVFVPPPGPDTATARTIAARYGAPGPGIAVTGPDAAADQDLPPGQDHLLLAGQVPGAPSAERPPAAGDAPGPAHRTGSEGGLAENAPADPSDTASGERS